MARLLRRPARVRLLRLSKHETSGPTFSRNDVSAIGSPGFETFAGARSLTSGRRLRSPTSAPPTQSSQVHAHSDSLMLPRFGGFR